MTKQLKVSRRSEIGAFVVMDMFATANEMEAQGRDIIRMEAGQPSAGVPARVIEAARKALEDNRIGYTQSLGTPPLRARIAQYYQEIYGIEVPADRVVVTTGSSGGFLLTFLSLFDPGNRVALPSPGYPAYRNILQSLNIEPVTLETTAENRWMPTAGDIAALHAKTPLDGLLLASPNNPTGTMADAETLQSLTEICAELGIWFISDEIYHGLTYGEPAQTALEFSDDAIIINSFSKYFAMTGWRIGWMVVPERLMRPVERLVQNHFISAPKLSQVAALAALDAREELEQIKVTYAANRTLLLEELPKAGLDEFLPVDGAFYIYADVHKFSNDSYDFARKMLEETGVAVTPGIDFDQVRGQQYIRMCFAGSTRDMKQAASRLKTWLK